MPADLFGPTPRIIDCSAFAILCYKAAGYPDPSGTNAYDGYGWTGDMITNCKPIPASTAQPSDLCFYGPSVSDTKHVTVYVGNGLVVSMGQQGDPSIGAAAQMGPAGFLGYFRPNPPATGLTAPISANPIAGGF